MWDLEDLLAQAGPALLEALLQSQLDDERRICEGSLYEYLVRAWPQFDPALFAGNWHIRVICEHLEAVSRGEIRRLIVNIPPRMMKTSIVAIAWPTWTWAQMPDDERPLMGPGVRFLCASYGAKKAEEDAVTARRLIASPWYQRLWGDRLVIAKDRDNAGQYDTTAGGSRISTGIPESLGKGGIIRILDDPHKTTEVESQTVVEGQVRAYNEVWRTRSNDPQQGAEVLIMQRQAEGDLSGYLLENEGGEIVHLCLPAEFESDRRCMTAVNGWWLNAWGQRLAPTDYEFADPREEDGEPLWAERFDNEWCARQQRVVGEFAWAGQFQQRPAPRGGGIVRREWWLPWPPSGEEDKWRRLMVDEETGRQYYIATWPAWELTIGYVDTAFTEKEENAFCAMTTWGVFADSGGRPKVAMTGAWRDRPTLKALATRILDTARRRKLDVVVLENKAGANWVQLELQRLMDPGEFRIDLDNQTGFAKGSRDKVSRLHSVSALFEGGVIHAPDTTWSEMVIAEVSQFPKGRWKDLCLCAGTEIVTRRGILSIEEVRRGDEALTPFGWREVTAAGLTDLAEVIDRGFLQGTPDHLVFSIDEDWQRLDTVSGTKLSRLTLCDLIWLIPLKRLSGSEQNFGGSEVRDDTMVVSSRAALWASMLLFGNMSMALRFQQGTRYIIETTTLLISALTIWSAYRKLSIGRTLKRCLQKLGWRRWTKLEQLQACGTNLLLDVNGTVRSLPAGWLPLEPNWQQKAFRSNRAESVIGAEVTNSIAAIGADSAASFAETNTNPLPEECGGAIRLSTTWRPVYNLTVAGARCYYANGVLVHNCDTVSGALGYLRQYGLIRLADEHAREEEELRKFNGRRISVAEMYGVG